MGWYETNINGAPVVTHNGDPGDFHSTMVISPSTGWGVVLLMNGSNGQARLDVLRTASWHSSSASQSRR